MKRPFLLLVSATSLLLLTGCSSILTNAVGSSTPAPAPIPAAASDFDESTLPTVTEEEYVTALTTAYTTFLATRKDDEAIILTSEPTGNYGEGTTVNSVVNPDGTYQSSTSITLNGTTTIITSICIDATTCFVSSDDGETWLQGVGSGNDWSPANRARTSLLLVNPEGETTGIIYRMNPASGQYSVADSTGIPLQNTVFSTDSVTDYKTLVAPGEREPSTTVIVTSFGNPVPVEEPENILEPLNSTP